MKYFFSVICPVYNVKEYLDEAIQSVVGQTYKNVEIILVDDGSTDGSGMICDTYSSKYSNIITIHQENDGLSGARNAGIQKASGKYILFLDADDMLAEDSLTCLDNAIREQGFPECIVNRRQSLQTGREEYSVCRYYFDVEKLQGLKGLQLYEALTKLPECWLTAWIFTVSRDAILRNQLFFVRGITHEDDEWSVRLFLQCKSFGFCNSILYSNRLNREGSIIQRKDIDKVFCLIDIADRFQMMHKDTEDLDDRRILEKVCANIVLRSLAYSKSYTSDPQYSRLVEHISNRTDMLNIRSKTYKLTYFLCRMTGVRHTANFLYFVRNLKRRYEYIRHIY